MLVFVSDYDSRGQRAKRARWQRTEGSLVHLATAARVKYAAVHGGVFDSIPVYMIK